MSGDRKAYLGDGVYASIEHGMIRLVTSNGVEDSPPIYLEPQVLSALWDYADRIGLFFR